ncbi:hypothetical protein F4820DRAFT_426189 [Hypoxylon rubiginosum]|uniref:Uncharacterized protein n=1 Tax=Hypoxylon rubiginosum TaxID=110542 RepID=A0ACB9YWT5_9PEZI|nr:hypothetical protein F4820DRAFT_426189 [Hypoxylon rubiginosum]
MCVVIWRRYRQCGCRAHLTTHFCNDAKGRPRNADNVLTRTKFLPDKPPKEQTPCKKTSNAASPLAAKCIRCAKKEKEMQKAGASAAALPMSTNSSVSQGKNLSGILGVIEEKASGTKGAL